MSCMIEEEHPFADFRDINIDKSKINFIMLLQWNFRAKWQKCNPSWIKEKLLRISIILNWENQIFDYLITDLSIWNLLSWYFLFVFILSHFGGLFKIYGYNGADSSKYQQWGPLITSVTWCNTCFITQPGPRLKHVLFHGVKP